MLLLLLLLLIFISPLAGLIPAGHRLLVGKRSFVDVLPMSGILALLGLFYVPIVEVDLSRYFAQLDTIRNFASFGAFFRSLDITQKIQVSQQVFFYVMSQFSWNNLLPFVVVILVATVGFYIIKDYLQGQTFPLPLQGLIYLSFIMLMPWGQVITNIRYISSLAVFMLALYRDVYQQKHSFPTWLLYLVASTMHIATIAFVAIRVLMYVVQKVASDIDKRQRTIIIVVFVLLLLLISQTSVFKMFASKAIFYLNGGGEGSSVAQWFEQADRSIGRRTGKQMEMAFAAAQLAIMGSAVFNARKHADRQTMMMFSFTLLMLGITLFWTFLAGTTWIRFAFMVDFCAVFIIAAEERYLKNQTVILINQTAWIGMLLWSIVWQAYQYVGSEMMTRADYYNILFPFRWLLQ